MDADPGRPVREGTASEALGLLADALLGRVEQLVIERIDGLAVSGAAESADARWLRVSEVAERVGACERTVYRALRSGALAGERLGAHWRIRPAAVEAWLAGSGARTAMKRPSIARAPSPTPPRARETTFRARARALRSTPPPASQSASDGRRGAPREEST